MYRLRLPVTAREAPAEDCHRLIPEESAVAPFHIDTLARTLASSPSRRRVLVGLTGGLLAALPSALIRDDIEAKKKGKGKRKKKKKHKQQQVAPAPPLPPVLVTNADAACSGAEDFWYVGNDGNNARLAQTFTAIASGPLVSVQVLTRKFTGTAGDYTLQLNTVDATGKPTNTVLAAASLSSLDLPDEVIALADFAFPSPFAVAAGAKYALVLSRAGLDVFSWFGHDGNTCLGGAFLSTSQTAAFTSPFAGIDLIFTTFVTS
jgi:hypothetical protein